MPLNDAYPHQEGTADSGKFILAIRRVDWEWRIAAGMDNPNRRPGPPPQPPG